MRTSITWGVLVLSASVGSNSNRYRAGSQAAVFVPAYPGCDDSCRTWLAPTPAGAQ